MLEQFLRKRLEKKPLQLMTHLVCGYPSFEDNFKMLKIMEEANVCAVEFQFPFSEPMADGPLFCRANQESLSHGTTVQDCFDFMARAKSMPFAKLMMGYYNTALQLGDEIFCQKLAEASASGFILPDLPPEDAGSLAKAALKHNLAPIHLMTPTASPERLQEIGKQAQGFVYCVARRGVTGAKTAFTDELKSFLENCRQATSLPLAVGFGVSSLEDLQFLRGKGDIAIIGTAFLKAWEQGGEALARKFLLNLAEG